MITLSWKLHKLPGADYYYTFYNNKFWFTKAEHIKDGVVTDSESVYQVTTSKMDERTKFKLIERLSYLFPELPLQQIKDSLRYDKNVSISE